MAHTRFSPLRDFMSMRDSMDRLFEDSMGQSRQLDDVVADGDDVFAARHLRDRR